MCFCVLGSVFPGYLPIRVFQATKDRGHLSFDGTFCFQAVQCGFPTQARIAPCEMKSSVPCFVPSFESPLNTFPLPSALSLSPTTGFSYSCIFKCLKLLLTAWKLLKIVFPSLNLCFLGKFLFSLSISSVWEVLLFDCLENKYFAFRNEGLCTGSMGAFCVLQVHNSVLSAVV